MRKPLHLGPYDCTLQLLRTGNPFIHNFCERYQTDIFTIRLMLRRTVCMRGPAAAEAFYHPGRMTRVGAVPPNVLALLQDKGSVHTLDDEAHRVRKQMFMSMMSPAALEAMVKRVVSHLDSAASTWQQSARVALHAALQTVYCQSICEWVGIDLAPAELKARSQELAAMIDGAGSVGIRHLRGHWLRRRTERWARELIRAQRQRPAPAEPPTPLASIAAHRDADGRLLPVDVAAVELINLLRPTGENSQYFVYTQWASQEDYENWRDSRANTAAHASDDGQPRKPVASGSDLLEFEIVEL